MRSHEDFGNGTRFGPTEIVRNAREGRFRNGNVFSLRAAASDSEDSIADCPGAGVFAKTFDFTCELEARNVRRITPWRRIAAEPLQNIGAIDSSGADSHAHAISRWLRRIKNIDDLQTFDAAERSDLHGFHFRLAF